MILSVTLNPSVDHTLFVDRLKLHDTNRVQRVERDAGGKGVNLSRIVASLGGETYATGFLGGGPGAYVRKVLDGEGVPQNFVEVKGDTRVNFSVEDGSGEPPTTFNEKGPQIAQQNLTELFSLISQIGTGGWLTAGGSLPRDVEPTIYVDLINLARNLGMRVSVDADNEPMIRAVEAGPDLIKPNHDEASRILGYEVTPDNAVASAKDIQKRIERVRKGAQVLLSMGKHGAVLATGDQCLLGHSPSVEAKSTIGCGDSLLGGFLFAETQSYAPAECLRWGLAAGAATAMTDGSAIGSQNTIVSLLKHAVVTEV